MNSAKLGLLCAVVFLITACGEVAPVKAEPVVRTAKLIEIAPSKDIENFRYPAVISAFDSSKVTFQVPGLLQDIKVKEGETVRKGQVLARLDQRDYKTALQSAQAQYDNASLEYERAKRLIESDAISRSVLEQRESQHDIAKANLSQSQKALNDTVLKAPFNAVVADVHIKNFETAAAGQAIMTLQSEGLSQALVQVPASVVVNSEQIELIDVYLSLDADPTLELPAVLSENLAIADQNTQTIEARFKFTPPKALVILPGMTGTLNGQYRIVTDSPIITQNPIVPISAVQSEAGKTYVWVVDSSTMRVSKQAVTVHPGVSNTVVVSGGLSVGDVIVGAGGHYLTEGAQVRPYKN